MMPMIAAEIAAATAGVLRGEPGAALTGVSTDSRSVGPGQVFFALRGPNFDGHSFVAEVFSKGAAAVVVERDDAAPVPEGAALITVGDTLKALGELAALVRGRRRIPLVAVTGSAGKTTTKEMIAAILSRSRSVLKTEGNLNNLIGLPLTLLKLGPEHEAAVVELGISEGWEMERLAAMCAPDVAVITNIGRAHLETLGSVEGVARAKGPLFGMLSPRGVKVVNLDDPWVVRLAEGSPGASVTYGSGKEADVVAEQWRADEALSGMTVVYRVRGERVEAYFSAPSVANVINGAAAMATALALGVPTGEMAAGLASFQGAKGRMSVVRAGAVTVLDDTYNANPESMAAALRTLAAASGRKVAVLGDMLELGGAGASEHAGVGALAREAGVDLLITVGAFSRDTAGGAKGAGLAQVRACTTKKEAIGALRAVLAAGDTVLVKASRGAALEEVVEAIKGMEQAGAAGPVRAGGKI